MRKTFKVIWIVLLTTYSWSSKARYTGHTMVKWTNLEHETCQSRLKACKNLQKKIFNAKNIRFKRDVNSDQVTHQWNWFEISLVLRKCNSVTSPSTFIASWRDEYNSGYVQSSVRLQYLPWYKTSLVSRQVLSLLSKLQNWISSKTGQYKTCIVSNTKIEASIRATKPKPW